jgi:hypothetical protein
MYAAKLRIISDYSKKKDEKFGGIAKKHSNLGLLELVGTSFN